jgi:RNA polymerase sigma factor (sigma-70 family)
MKKYNIKNYVIYQDDLKQRLRNLPPLGWDEYTRDQLITKFMPLSENLARKFATSHQAIGVLSIDDLIQFGHIGLINAVDKLNWDLINESDNAEQTLKSFLSKRIKGTIRRSINHNMGDIKLPEWKINEIRKGSSDPILNNLLSQSKSIYLGDFVSNGSSDSDYELEIADESTEYNVDFMNSYLLSLLNKHLSGREADVIRLSYGLDCATHNAVEICALFNIEGSYKMKGVRISEIKRDALEKLIRKTNEAQSPDSL